jgi:hypothetical protein
LERVKLAFWLATATMMNNLSEMERGLERRKQLLETKGERSGSGAVQAPVSALAGNAQAAEEGARSDSSSNRGSSNMPRAKHPVHLADTPEAIRMLVKYGADPVR